MMKARHNAGGPFYLNHPNQPKTMFAGFQNNKKEAQ